LALGIWKKKFRINWRINIVFKKPRYCSFAKANKNPSIQSQESQSPLC